MNILVLVIVALAVNRVMRAGRPGEVPMGPFLGVLGLALAALLGVGQGASFLIDLAWWKELGHAASFWQIFRIEWLPQTLAALASFVVLFAAFLAAGRR
ncbi:MAG: hypothetical protein KGL53_03580, partial [Elusimicrobia bacterium]|nr:hypothetical protein [Elusimicrobiota bacterium]